jgi:cytochrome b561
MSFATTRSPVGYKPSQIVLHWLAFALVTFLFFTGDNMTHAFNAMRKTGAPALSFPWIPIHIAAGLTVLVLMIWRLSLRLRVGAPPPPADEAAPLRWLAGGVHGLLYALLIAAPIGGLVGFFINPTAAEVHHFMVRAPLLALVTLHVVGAAWHLIFKRDNVMQRMLRPT